jgi:hypothetical protein
MKLGSKMSAESRAKMSARVRRPEELARLATLRKGRPHTVETRAKMSLAHAGNKSALGYRHTAETLAIMSAASKGAVFSAERREKMGAARRGKINSPEARAKMSVAVRKADEEGRRKIHVIYRYSSLAKALHLHLSSQGLVLEPEVRFGRFTVDLYDREHHVAYEADGTFWHEQDELKRPGCGVRRDAYLVEYYGLKVVHYTDKEISALTGWPKKRTVAA